MLHVYYNYFCNSSDNSSWLNEVTRNSTSYVTLNDCFQASVLVWPICFTFWALSPFWLQSLARQITGEFLQIRVAWLLLCKTLTTLALITNELIYLSFTTNYFEKSSDDYFLHYANSTILMVSFVSILI